MLTSKGGTCSPCLCLGAASLWQGDVLGWDGATAAHTLRSRGRAAAAAGAFNRARFPISPEVQGAVVAAGWVREQQRGGTRTGNLPSVVAVSWERRGRSKGGRGTAGLGAEQAQEVLSHRETGLRAPVLSRRLGVLPSCRCFAISCKVGV